MMNRPADEPRTSRTVEFGQDLPVLVERFGLGRVTGIEYLVHGLMNPNWRVETDTGVFVVKRIVDVPLERARRNLATPGALASFELPVCAPFADGEGEYVVEAALGRGYCIFPWVEGVHVEGGDLTFGEAARLGELTGRLHRGLRQVADDLGWPPVSAEVRSKVGTVEVAAREADRFLDVIGALDAPVRFDRAAAAALRQRKAMLANHAGHHPVSERPQCPVGWTHGDLQYRNLLWRDGSVAAVLDWDRVAMRPLAEEVVRTAQVQFAACDGRWDLDRAATFVAGYRGVVDLTDEELGDAVERLWWKRLTDFWPLQWHYDKGDFGCDELWESGEALLAWWCEHSDLVKQRLVGAAAPIRG
jgi:homoserine kinase type II